jgi:8-hydroxy-5-deazaflavin:NADPH oxidoreductase
MQIGIIGAGRIGGNIGRQLSGAGHSLVLSFARDRDRLSALADEIGASIGTPADAADGSDVVVISVPWSTLPQALAEAGPLTGKIVIDTTNAFGSGPRPAAGQTAAAFNAARMSGARYTKSFNTLTAQFQAQVAHRPAEQRVVQWICGDDTEAKQVVASLVDDAGYVPVDLGGTADCHVMESPRRPGAVYGEEYRLPEALAVLECLRAGRPIPPTPQYA